MTTHIVWRPEGYYVQFLIDNRVVDTAGPFDEEYEAEDCANRY